jgi:hypothetical protein
MITDLWPAAIIASVVVFSPVLRAARLVPENVTVGQHLEIVTTVALDEPAPAGGLKVTLTSSDPELVRFSNTLEGAASPKLELLVRAGYRSSPEFYIQGHGRSGSVAYTATAPGFASSTGTVALSPSGVIFARSGSGVSQVRTTTGAGKQELAVYSVLLDSELNVIHPQPVASGLNVSVEITNSEKTVGSIGPSVLTIKSGAAFANMEFQPLSAGETVLSMVPPQGFSSPAQFARVAVSVSKPGMGITDEISIGQNLQAHGTLTLGEVAPSQGVTVTLTSSDPAKLLFSTSPTEPGLKQITIPISPGGFNGSYYLHALAASGHATYRATAPGFRDREATVTLTPSGLVIGGPQGPPDEAELLSKEIGEGPHGFVTNMSERDGTVVSAYSVQLDPVTLRGADLTVQAVRPGASVTVVLTNSNPAVGKLRESQLVIPPGKSSAVTYFVPAAPGMTRVAVATPDGYTQAKNSTSLSITIKQ